MKSKGGQHRASSSVQSALRLLATATLSLALGSVSITGAVAATNIAERGSAKALPSLGSSTAPSRDATTVWLCRPGFGDDPCTASLDETVVQASGATSVVDENAGTSSAFDCFYVYPTVSREPSDNADLRVQKAEIDVAVGQASRFSRVCRVFAPMYRQVTLGALATYPDLDVPSAYGEIAYESLLAGFKDYLAKYNNGRPIVFIGHSQGATMLIKLLASSVDNDPALRSKLVLAIILGGDVEVRTGSLEGGSFKHITACSWPKESGCVIAYSSFPGEPPASALFGRPGQGVALQSGQVTRNGRQVLCVDPADFAGGPADLDSFFPSEGAVATPWVEFPALYRARCESSGGATWLQVQKATGRLDKRPVVTEEDGANWGYHTDDVNLALGNLVADVSSAESTWSEVHKLG